MCIYKVECSINQGFDFRSYSPVPVHGVVSITDTTKANLFLQIMENAEINNIIKILGLQYKKNYSDPESLKSLRYGKLMIMTDQVRLYTVCLLQNIRCSLCV